MRAGRATPLAQLLLAALLAASAPAFADYKSTYAQGLKAAREGDWAKVEARMRDALAEESTPAARVDLAGKNYQPYVPQFFLGLAAYKRGDCAAAVRNLDHGPTRAAVGDAKARPKLADFIPAAEAGLRDCQQRVAVVEPPKPTLPEPPKPVEPKPVEPKPVEPGPKPVVPEPKPIVGPTPTPTPKPPEPKPTPPVPSATPAPALLTAALDNYLAGRYAEAASVDPAQLADRRARFHALLIRAAARYTRAQLEGDPTNAFRSQAETDIRAAKALQPSQSPDPQIFSPRFRQFYAATR